MSNARKLGNMTTHGLDGDFNVDPTDNTLVVDSTNNRVGIGSATPTTTLDITGTATATAFSGPLTGNVTGTTSSISNHDTDALSEGSTNLYYTNARADARAQLKIDALVDSAPNTLDTLNELAAALGDDANFSTTITNSIATKLPLAGGTVTGELNVDAQLKANQLRLSKNGDSTSIGATIGLSNAGGDTNSNDITITAASSTNSIVLRSAINIDTQTYQSGSWNSRLKILQNGNVGIGTSSPSTNLQVDGDWASDYGTMSISGPQNALTGIGLRANNTYVGSIIWRDGSTGTGGSSHLEINSYLSNPIELKTNNTARVTIDGSSGNVGIGTDDPERGLHVVGGIHLPNNNKISWDQANGNLRNAIYVDSGDDMIIGDTNFDDIYFSTGQKTKTVVIKQTTGNVGIGTDDPGKLLTLSRATEAQNEQLEFRNVGGISDGNFDGIKWSQGATGSTMLAEQRINYYSSGVVDMSFNLRSEDNVLYLQAGGNVGIGTASPAYKLDVFNNTTDTGSQLRVKNSYTAVGAAAIVNIDGYGASTLKLWRNGIEEWKLERITNSDNLGLYAYGGAVSGGAGAGLIQFWDYDTGGIGIGTNSPSARLEIYDSHGGNTADHSSYGHPSSGGSNGALYINKPNSRIDWESGLVFCGEGTTWSARFTGRDGLTTNSDTDGEILGVHPVEGSATASWTDTAGADDVASAYFRVMGNGKTFADKLYAEDAFIAPSHATDAAANSAGGNVAGSIYYNTASNVHRSYNGTQWTSVGSAPITESVFDAFRDGSALCLLKGNNSNVDTGGNHTGSLQGGATYTTTTKFGSHAFDLVGAGVYLDIPTLPMIETVSFWFYCVSGNPGYIVDFRHDNPNNGRSYLYTHAGASGGTGQHVDMGDDTTTTNRTGVIYINGAQYTSGQYNFLVGNWYHIVIVRNSTDTHRTWDQGIRFGNRSDGTTHGDAGHFDQIRVFNSRISASQAFDLYNETG
jgi:hypothetical protein